MLRPLEQAKADTVSAARPYARRRDTELVYRVGVDLFARAEAEQAPRAELAASGETSCAWSQPGQSHVVAVGSSGVVRQGLTIDPRNFGISVSRSGTVRVG